MSRDSRDPYDDSDRRNGRHSANGNGPSSPSRSSRPSDPGRGRRTPPNGLIKPPLPPAGGGPRSSRPSDPRSGRRTSGENYTLARMHAPRGGRAERPERDMPERDDREMDEREAPERAPRGRRGVGAMARDLSRSMSRSIQALGRSFSRAIREAGTYEQHGVRPTPLPPEVMEELAELPYRRSRARVVARKWRLKRIGPNPIVMAVVVMLLLVAVVVVLGIGGAGGIYAVSYYQSHQTDIQQIYNLRFTQGVQIFDRNGQQLFVARSDQNGINIYTGLSNISDKVQKATIDTEDATFWTNNGVDLYRTIGAAVADLKSGQNDQGASTITQQVVKNIVAKDNAKTYQRKVNEAILAYGLTLNYTKAQILEMYLNTIDYGDQNTGIEAAARNYFGIQPIPDPNNPKNPPIMASQQLDWWQAAILAGLPNAPSYYLPIQYSCDKAPCDDTKWANPCLNNPHDATCNPNPNYDSTVGTGDGHEWLVYRRSLIILGNLFRYHDITLDLENVAIQKIHDCLVNQCMGHWLAYQNTGANGSTGSNSAGSNTSVVPEKAPWFVDYIIQELATDFGVTDPEHTALQVYTTLDENYQAYAEHTVNYYVAQQHKIRWPLYAPGGCTTCLVPSLADYANGHDGATVAIDPRTGDILAMVGSVNYTDQSKQVAGNFNVVTANRSMGSATKGVVYATAFQKGWNPGIMLQDMPICWPNSATVDDPGKPDDGQKIQDNDAQACVGYYAPHNFDPESFSGNAPIRVDLANSLNIPATEAMSFVGDTAVTSQDFISMASRMGIDTLKPGFMGPSTALGTQDIPLLELTSAYGTFADGGKHTPVRSILRIQGPDGTPLYQAPTPSPQQVISPQAAYMLTSVLTDNEAREADFNVTNPLTNDSTTGVFAAKTGTSQGTTGPRDIITVGYSPFLVIGAWVGNANNDDLKSNIIGISGAGYIFADMLQWAHDNYKWPNEQFPIPPDMARGQFNCVTGLAPYAGTTPGQCQLQPFKSGSTPLYFGWTHDYSGLHMDEDWYIQGQQWLQS